MEEIFIKEKILKEIFPIELKNLSGEGDEICSISASEDNSNDYFLNRERKSTKSKKTKSYIEKLSIVMVASYIVEIIEDEHCVSLVIDDKAYSFSLTSNFGTTMLLIKNGSFARGVDIDCDDTMAISDEILRSIGREAMEAKKVIVDLPGAAFSKLAEKEMYNILLRDFIYVDGHKFIESGTGDFELDESDITALV